MQQYILPLNRPNSYASDDFIFSSCNQSLKDLSDNLADRWGYDPYPEIILLVGPKSAGKTHFSHLLHERIPSLIIVDDIDNQDEEELLHRFNISHENHQKTFFTCKEYKHFKLPDLTSRLASARTIHIDSPDDFMIQSLLVKALTERSIKVTDDVIKFLLARIPRSFSAIEESVDLIDRLSIEQKRNISVPFLSSLQL